MSFVHLHTHTHYSMLDSTIRIPDLIARAVADDTPAIAMTDHNNLFGGVDFFKAAKKAGIRAIMGTELNIVAEGRMNEAVRRSFSIVLLCRTNEGYRNLCYLLSRAHMDSPTAAPIPRIDRALLKEYSAGLIGLSGGLAGEIGQALMRGEDGRAREIIQAYQGIFEPEMFFLEVIRNGIQEQEDINAQLARIGDEMGVELVAAADAHYDAQEDAAAHEILMCIQLGKTVPELDTRARLTDRLHLAPASEMVERFSDMPRAVDNTLKIAELCDVTLDLGNVYLPSFDTPDGVDESGFLRQIATDGLTKRLKEVRALGIEADEKVYRDRLEIELAIIIQMGFPGYFLIVWDFIKHAIKVGCPVGPGRGSGAGSLVAYSLRITDIDPMQYGLLFERFLNPERVSMPDFDIDFCMNKRELVIRYVTERYGRDNVGQIITYGTMKAKAVVRDVARVLGLTFAEADRAAKLIPDDLGMTLDKAFIDEPRLQELCDEDPRYAKLFEMGRSLEGLNRQPGMHAAGVVIGDKPLWEYVPLYAVPEDVEHRPIITQFAKNEVEEAGLVKFDFLGLKTLTVVDHALRHVNTTRAALGEAPLDIATIPLDDKPVFDLVTSGNTTGVFQLESSGFKKLLRKLKPDCFEDIIAAVALYRPGPLQSGMVDAFVDRKHGREPIEYPHPWLSEVLEETYGVIVYQEQVMQSASLLAGFSLGQADILRRAMGKKKASEMAKQRTVFAAGCEAKGVDAKQAGEIFDTIEKFAGYGFNKSHSAAYGLISYQTAWLKTHYPVEFMASLLTCDGDNTDKVVRFISEARAMGITVLPPSVSHSQQDFAVHEGAIRFGMGAVKGVGGGAVEAIIEERDANGPFESLFDLCDRVDLRRVNKRVLEALTKCGAFDEFDLTRMAIFDSLAMAIERGQRTQRDKAAGQFSLFGALAGPEPAPEDTPVIIAAEEWPDRLLLAYEKDCLGFYVSGHPLDRYAADMKALGCDSLSNLQQAEPRQRLTYGAVISEMRERPLKSGNGRMAFLTLEDLSGQAEMVVFSKAYEAGEEAIKSGEPLLVRASAKIEGEGEGRVVKLRCEEIATLASRREDRTRLMLLKLPAERANPAHLSQLKAMLGADSSGVPVRIIVKVPELGEARVALGEGYRARVDDDLVSRLERVVGKGGVEFVA